MIGLMVPSAFAVDDEWLDWDKDRPLVWNDFQGIPDESDDATMSSIYMDGFWEFDVAGGDCNYKFTDAGGVASFNRNESWIREGEDYRSGLLYHQILFNIMQVHAEKFANDLLNNNLPCLDGNYDVDKINDHVNQFFDKTLDEGSEMQDLFILETEYGINTLKLVEWNKKINPLLGFKEEPAPNKLPVSSVPNQVVAIPAWIKNNAGWWADGQIDDTSFLQGIQFLIKEGIMIIPSTETSDSSESQEVPAWIKNNAGWWADGQIDDNTFVSGIQFLIKVGIVIVQHEQMQSSTDDIETQKTANEYWSCYYSISIPKFENCAYNDKYHLGGIKDLIRISEYDVSCDIDCNLSLYNHYDVSNRLEKFQNEDHHKQLFDMYVSITPNQILDDVVFVSFVTDDHGGEQSAAVLRDSLNPFKFTLEIDPLDMIVDGSIGELWYKAVMIHENAHILSLGQSQSDNDLTFGDYTEPYTEIRKIIDNKKSTCAPNYYTDVAGCMNDASYINLFYQKFWLDVKSSHKWYFEFDNADKFLDDNERFYQTHKKQFVTNYAATNPDEDFAESFTAFVLKEKPTTSTIADQKIQFFYDFPELVEMRDFMRSNL